MSGGKRKVISTLVRVASVTVLRAVNDHVCTRMQVITRMQFYTLQNSFF